MTVYVLVADIRGDNGYSYRHIHHVTKSLVEATKWSSLSMNHDYYVFSI